jgi:hypothetical protein
MKKNLQLALALTLGFATTVSAQDWSVSSNTRVNNMDVSGVTTMDTEQMTRMGVSFGTDAVSVNATFNADYNLGGGDATFGVHTASATTNLMSFASVTAGRMALNLGSGRIIGSNDWNNDGNTWDGMMFGINNDFADLSVGYASMSMEGAAEGNYDNTQMMFNVAKDMGDMGFNLVYVSTDASGAESTAMGLDGTYAMANGADVSFGYYTAEAGETEMGLMSVGVDYGVSDDLNVSVGYDMYDENGFWLASGNVGGADSFMGTGMNAITEECDVMSFGGTYAMGDFTFGATMYNVTNEAETVDYSVTDMSLHYNLSDNSSLGVMMSNNDDDSRMWMSVKVGF